MRSSAEPVVEMRPKSQLVAAARGKVGLEYLLNIKGTRLFPTGTGRNYRFDIGSNKVQYMTADDANALIKRFGDKTFKVQG